MRGSWTWLPLASLALSATVALSACGSSSSGGDTDEGAGGAAGSSSSGGSGGSGAAPFSVDPTMSSIYAKVLAPTCGLSTACHKVADPAATAGASIDLFGVGVDPSMQASVVRTHLVSQASIEAPMETLVVPGHPEQSYLIHKLTPGPEADEPDEASLSCYGNTDNPPVNSKQGYGCGDLMPQGVDPFKERDVVVAAITQWIMNGANDD